MLHKYSTYPLTHCPLIYFPVFALYFFIAL